MKVKDLLDKYSTSEIIIRYYENYYKNESNIDLKQFISNFSKIINNMKKINCPTSKSYAILCRFCLNSFCMEEDENLGYYTVSLYKIKSFKTKFRFIKSFYNIDIILKFKESRNFDKFCKMIKRYTPSSYSLSFIPWKTILSYRISENNINDIGELNLLTHILYEMTFYGFDEETINKKANEIKEISNNIKRMRSLIDETDKLEDFLDDYNSDNIEQINYDYITMINMWKEYRMIAKSSKDFLK